MRYYEFERVISGPRMARYLRACAFDTRKSMTLYRYNLRLTQELYTVTSCFEVVLRNALDTVYQPLLGTDWIRDAVAPGGIFTQPRCRKAAEVVRTALSKLASAYSHPKLTAELSFGFWRYLFATPQFNAGGQRLLAAFLRRPADTPTMLYDQAFFFRELGKVHNLRNRMAHHEPICFQGGIIDTTDARQQYQRLRQLFRWMGVDEQALLYGLDHVESVCNDIDAL